MTHQTAGSPPAARSYPSRLWIKLLLAYLLPTGLIVVAMGWLALQAARNAVEHQLGESLIAIARTAASTVGRPRAISLQPGDEGTRTYHNLVDKLAELKRATRVERIVLFDRGERALVDSQADFAIGEPLTELAANRTELQAVFRGEDRSSVLFTGRDGRWYKTGYAPVSLDGQVVAAVGVAGSATFFVPLNRLGQTLGIVGASALALVVMVTLLISRRITLPLGRLAQAARAIGRGELHSEIEVETSDEIGVLANTLNEMRLSIRSRDRQLQMMLSGIAHEVRNPLGGMTLFVGLLKEELERDAQAAKHVDRIASELEHLSRVVNDFLDFARRKPLSRDSIDPRTELEQIHALCAGQLAESNITLSVKVAADIKSVRWDRERMRRALLNLLRNAIQATSAGGRVELRLESENDGLLITVRDEGCGIPADQRDRVFEPFFTTRQKGTGLGLALVRRIVESHGGAISFTSLPGRTTTFRIHLPTVSDDRPMEAS